MNILARRMQDIEVERSQQHMYTPVHCWCVPFCHYDFVFVHGNHQRRKKICLSVCKFDTIAYTVEPPIVDPPTKGHNIIDLSTKDTGQGPQNLFPYSSNTFRTSDERATSLQRTQQLNLYWPQSVLYSEVPLYTLCV